MRISGTSRLCGLETGSGFLALCLGCYVNRPSLERPERAGMVTERSSTISLTRPETTISSACADPKRSASVPPRRAPDAGSVRAGGRATAAPERRRG